MARITFLGTGDPLNEERAQTSLALPIGGDDILLLDTGSGTIVLRQLQLAGIEPPQIRHIVVSHRHFDHAGGLAPLLVALVPIAATAVTVHAAPETLRSLRDLLALTIPGVEDWLGPRLRWHELRPEKAVALGDATLTPFTVEHGLECIGMKIVRAGRSVVFTADTAPCPNVVRWATDADLLIHEAYGLHDEAESAHTFGHSTATDAGKAAHAAAANRLLLTHLRSSRYANPHALATEAAREYGRPVEVANDLDTVEY
ncbi:MAG TPA: MBL fold metallo-hydrolase [Thermomicrobiales bacterium]|jgi:ribonuclease BN (tRNA processing enzyme)